MTSAAKAKFMSNKKFHEMSVSDAALRLGVGESTVRNYRRALGLEPVGRLDHARVARAKARIRADLDKIARDGKALIHSSQIAMDYGIAPSTVNKLLCELGIERKVQLEIKQWHDWRPYMPPEARELGQLLRAWR